MNNEQKPRSYGVPHLSENRYICLCANLINLFNRGLINRKDFQSFIGRIARGQKYLVALYCIIKVLRAS